MNIQTRRQFLQKSAIVTALATLRCIPSPYSIINPNAPQENTLPQYDLVSITPKEEDYPLTPLTFLLLPDSSESRSSFEPYKDTLLNFYPKTSYLTADRLQNTSPEKEAKNLEAILRKENLYYNAITFITHGDGMFPALEYFKQFPTFARSAILLDPQYNQENKDQNAQTLEQNYTPEDLDKVNLLIHTQSAENNPLIQTLKQKFSSLDPRFHRISPIPAQTPALTDNLDKKLEIINQNSLFFIPFNY
ncbi:MAG: hypothetical protein Q7S74_00460 [Nanoarchaeota archaeon]|nr:hypothetical protein [Nanoarchaeota archaeon]